MEIRFPLPIGYGPIGEWNVSRVTDFSHVFSDRRNHRMRAHFHEDIGNWDVSSGTDFSYMFYHCERFDTDLSPLECGERNKFPWNVPQLRTFQFESVDVGCERISIKCCLVVGDLTRICLIWETPFRCSLFTLSTQLAIR